MKKLEFTNQNGTITNAGSAKINKEKAVEILQFLTDLGFSNIYIPMAYDSKDNGITCGIMGDFSKKDISNLKIPSWFDENYVGFVLESIENIETDFNVCDFSDLNEAAAELVSDVDHLIWESMAE